MAALGHKRGSPDALCPITPPPDAGLMGCERQIDEISGLEVTCRGCGRKDSVAVTEGSLFKAAQGSLLNLHHVFSGAEEE